MLRNTAVPHWRAIPQAVNKFWGCLDLGLRFGSVDMLLSDFRTLNASPKLEFGQQPGAAPSRSWEPARGAGAGGTRSLSLPCSERIL